MSFRNGFTIEIYGFVHSLHTFWHVPLMMPSRDGAWQGDRGQGLRGQKTTPKRVQMYGRRLTAQQKDERW